MIGWIRTISRNRRARRLAWEAIKALAGDPFLRSLAQENQDRAFDAAVRAAARAAGLDIDAEQVRLTVAAMELELVHQRLVRENARHEKAMKP